MNTKIMILTVTKCSPKDKEPYTRIDYISLDKGSTSENVRGHIVAPVFMNGHTVFDKIPSNFIGQELVANISYAPNPLNPSRAKMIINSLTYKNETIDLL